MFISDLFEAQAKQTLVLIPGGFHPFHPGHLSLYRSAEQAFPGATIVYVATDDRKDRPFPFVEKQKLAQIAGVNPKNFQLVKSPFVAKEVTQNFDPNNTVLVFVRSEKDRDEHPKPGGVKKDGSPSYLQPYTKGNLAPMSQHGYMAYLPVVQFDAGPSGVTSATQIRNMWPQADDAQKNEIVTDLYPKNPNVAKQILDKYLGHAVAEASQDWEVKSAIWRNNAQGKREPQDVKSHFVRADRPSRAEKKASKEYEPDRKTWSTHTRGNQGVAEGYKFKGGFPFDVDHMPGAVIRNRDETTDIVKTKNKDRWDDEVDRINDEVFDDMSDFRTNSEGETVTGNSAVWAKWDNATQTGWINRKGQQLKPWPVKEQGVAEGSTAQDPNVIQMKKRARLAHPFAKSDEEALALYVNDREIRDVDNLEREQNRELKMIDRIQDAENKLQKEIDHIDQELAALTNALKAR